MLSEGRDVCGQRSSSCHGVCWKTEVADAACHGPAVKHGKIYSQIDWNRCKDFHVDKGDEMSVEDQNLVGLTNQECLAP